MMILVILGSAVIIGASIGSTIGFVLDKYRTKPGRHRKSSTVVRSTLPLTLPWLMVIAACLPVGVTVR